MTREEERQRMAHCFAVSRTLAMQAGTYCGRWTPTLYDGRQLRRPRAPDACVTISERRARRTREALWWKHVTGQELPAGSSIR